MAARAKRPVSLTAALLIAAAVLAVGVVSRYRDMAAVDRHQCVLILRLNGAIVDSLEASRRAPLPRYYRTHPVEAHRQLRALDREIARFKSINCTV